MEENQEDRTERKQWQWDGYLKNLLYSLHWVPKNNGFQRNLPQIQN